MTLRRRLVVTLIVLVAAGFTAAGAITLTSLHSYLYGRIDDQLTVAAEHMQVFVARSEQRGLPITADAIDSRVNPDVYVEILDQGGHPVVTRPSGTNAAPDPAPTLPHPLPVQASLIPGRIAPSHGPYRPDAASVNVPSATRHGPEYRLQASPLPGGTLVVATRLDAVDATLASLRTVELAVSLGVLAASIVLLMLVVRRGLRPLEDMAGAAGAIAAGDLTRRVRPDDEHSEVGRLGRALNGMLVQIEAAFDQRTASEERLRRFVADASHELRTPLTSIRGYAELLRKDALASEEAREQALARIESEAARMGVLVEDLLVLARLGEEPQPEQHRIDLVPLVTDAVADARAVARARRITLTAPGPVPVAADEQGLGRIVHNLLTNALTHTPPGTPVDVVVAVEGGRAVLRVRDEGPGMEADEAARVFDRFYRGDAAGSGGGSGLGLFIVAAVARSLGGRARVETAVGCGATFEIELPVYGSPPLPGNRADSAVPPTVGSRPGP